MLKLQKIQIRQPEMLAILAILLFLLSYFPALVILINKWISSDRYTHAFIALPLIFYMAYGVLRSYEVKLPKYSSIGLILIILSSACYMFSLLTQVHTVITLSMFMTLVGVILYLGGFYTVKALAVPLLLTALLIPVPEQLYIEATFPLQLKVSQISQVVIQWMGVPILREGNVMSIPGKTFEVVEACSGLRSLIALITLSIVFGFFYLSKTRFKLLLVLVSLPAAIFVNIIRVIAMISVWHFFKFDLTEGTIHTITGLAIFAIALLIMYLSVEGFGRWEKYLKRS